MMNHSIYYHRGFDGVASAALVLKWLRFEGQPERVNLRPVDYDSPWTQTRLPGRSIVVDFMYHPDATQYWDHHDSTFPKTSWKNHYRLRQQRGDEHLHWDPQYPSCAALILDTILDLPTDARVRELVHWATVIDSAAYESPDSLFSATEPGIRINLALAGADDEFFDTLARSLATASLEDVSNEPQVREAVSTAQDLQERELFLFRQNMTIRDNLVVVADISSNVLNYSRYALYSVVLHQSRDRLKLLCMRNPWIEFEPVDLGKLCQQFGGGGHPRVGAVLFNLDELARARESLNVVAECLTMHASSSRAMLNAAVHYCPVNDSLTGGNRLF